MISEAWTNGPAGVCASTPLKARRRDTRAPVPPARVRVGVRDPPLCPGSSGGRDCSGGLCPAGHRGTAGGGCVCVWVRVSPRVPVRRGQLPPALSPPWTRLALPSAAAPGRGTFPGASPAPPVPPGEQPGPLG